MDFTGRFEGVIIGAGTKLRNEHSNAGGSATVLASYGKDLKVIADKKWICDVADASKNWIVGDTWIHVTHVGPIDVVDGWMAVRHNGGDIVRLTVDLPDSETPPEVPADQVVTNSITYDYNVAGVLLAVWVNGEEWRRFYEPPIPPVGVSENFER